MFDLKDFYRSIKEILFREALRFGKTHKYFQSDVKVMFHLRKSLLYNRRMPCVKKGGSSFIVTIVADHGPESCKLVDVYLVCH